MPHFSIKKAQFASKKTVTDNPLVITEEKIIV
jgi:hypothetical protein